MKPDVYKAYTDFYSCRCAANDDDSMDDQSSIWDSYSVRSTASMRSWARQRGASFVGSWRSWRKSKSNPLSLDDEIERVKRDLACIESQQKRSHHASAPVEISVVSGDSPIGAGNSGMLSLGDASDLDERSSVEEEEQLPIMKARSIVIQ